MLPKEHIFTSRLVSTLVKCNPTREHQPSNQYYGGHWSSSQWCYDGVLPLDRTPAQQLVLWWNVTSCGCHLPSSQMYTLVECFPKREHQLWWIVTQRGNTSLVVGTVWNVTPQGCHQPIIKHYFAGLHQFYYYTLCTFLGQYGDFVALQKCDYCSM